MALAASVSGFIVSDSSEDTVSSRCTSAEGKAVHPVLSKFQPNLPLCTPPSGVRFLWYSHWRQSSKQPVSCSLGFPPLYDSRFAHIGEHFHCGRIVMVKEQTLSFIQSADGLHICFTQGEVKYIQVLFHPLFVSGFWDHDYIGLDQKPQGSLCSRFSVLFANFN